MSAHLKRAASGSPTRKNKIAKPARHARRIKVRLLGALETAAKQGAKKLGITPSKFCALAAREKLSRARVFTGPLRWPLAEHDRAERAGRFVKVTLTPAQRIQLDNQKCRASYRRFLRVATHDQLTALRGTVPLYWLTNMRDRGESSTPHELHSLRGAGPGGVVYAWMKRERGAVRAEFKRRGM